MKYTLYVVLKWECRMIHCSNCSISTGKCGSGDKKRGAMCNEKYVISVVHFHFIRRLIVVAIAAPLPFCLLVSKHTSMLYHPSSLSHHPNSIVLFMRNSLPLQCPFHFHFTLHSDPISHFIPNFIPTVSPLDSPWE